MTKKKKYNKVKRYSILKLILRIITLGVAIAALIIALQNKKDIEWMEAEQDLMIELGIFPKLKQQ